MLKIFVLLWAFCLYAADFDCIVVGSSPLSLFEALYKRLEGKSVLVVEQAPECGGAWKSVTVCGIPHVDLGCHEFGNNRKVKEFLESYAGCKMVETLDKKGEFYPSGGCFELIHNLERLLALSGVNLWLSHKLETLFLTPIAKWSKW